MAMARQPWVDLDGDGRPVGALFALRFKFLAPFGGLAFPQQQKRFAQRSGPIGQRIGGNPSSCCCQATAPAARQRTAHTPEAGIH
jgi:hypothetical protein